MPPAAPIVNLQPLTPTLAAKSLIATNPRNINILTQYPRPLNPQAILTTTPRSLFWQEYRAPAQPYEPAPKPLNP